ncbi:hypothetical protein FA95DRAFT_1558166 [Auriscalpium vulgare]|uniref:Uncharacterized protein n=1 Tax=Auriscalpium vulgare TaxID=40419 RepID=A0ACB8RWJ4_9AGAM|nr:hypothetical protein FA95DRAFT_1558166 [Auriscalpium vulgare]
MVEVIDLSSSPEPELQLRIARQIRRKRSPLFLPDFDEHEVIELSDSSDESSLSRKRRRVAAQPQAGSSKAPGSARGAHARRPVRLPSSIESSTSPKGKAPMRSLSIEQEQLPTPPRDVTPPRCEADSSAKSICRSFESVVEITPHRRSTPPRVSSPIPASVEEEVPSEDPQALYERYVAQVCEVVPDVHAAHVFELLERLEASHPDDLVGAVLHTLFEDPTYPRDLPDKGKGKASDSMVNAGSASTGVDYSRTDREYQGGPWYRDVAIDQLRLDFPLIQRDHISETLAMHEGFYAPTHLFLMKEDTAVESTTQLQSTAKRKGKGKAKPELQDDEFDREREWLLEKLREDTTERDQKLAEEINEQEYEDTGDGIECGCCFATYAFDKMIQCPEAHLFCGSCVTTYASTRLGEQKPDLPCMDASGCKLNFPDSELRRILPVKLLGLYERVRQRRDLEAAALEGLEECPFCEYRVVMDVDIEVDKLFRCQNEECGKVSCRKCKKEDHLPKSCEEVEEDKKLDGKHAVEEAMTRALMRNCPKCQKAFIKEYGCNKMTCPNCSALSCYVCRQLIVGYEHFEHNSRVQVPGQPVASSSSSKCPLWDAVEQRHADEVTVAAKKALEQYKLEHPDVDEDDIKVDLPPAPPAPVQPHPGNPPIMQHIHGAAMYQYQGLPGQFAAGAHPLPQHAALLHRHHDQRQLAARAALAHRDALAARVRRDRAALHNAVHMPLFQVPGPPLPAMAGLAQAGPAPVYVPAPAAMHAFVPPPIPMPVPARPARRANPPRKRKR